MTVLDHLLGSLVAAANHNRNDVVGPRVILWTDGERLWEPVVEALRTAIPRLFTLGEYDETQQTGPVAYLRFQVPAQPVAAAQTPILYLPGIPRTAFRSATDFPEDVRHLFALQFEGQFWLQKNGKDWTPAAFLASADGGLGLDVARDADTAAALRECLAKVLEADVSALAGRRLEAADFRSLVADDPVRMLLRWLGQPKLWRAKWQGPEWSSFRAICRKDYGFDPEKDGELAAAEKLAVQAPGWQVVWQRFAESPRSFPGVDEILSRLSPPDLFACQETYPSVNQQREHELRAALLGVADLPLAAGRARILELAEKEAPRMGWVWAKLSQASLASAVSALGRLVKASQAFAGGADWSGLALGYVQHGWQADAAALEALAAVRSPADLGAVEAALGSVYRPWLEKLAQTAQGLAASYPNRSSQQARQLDPTPGTVFLFVDGLRFDLGRLLAAELEQAGLPLELGHEWAALPTVTATAKPAWKPMASFLKGESAGGTFAPTEAHTDKPLTTERFRELLKSAGMDYLAAGEDGDPGRCAWTEVGAFDRHGHAEGKKLAWRVGEQLTEVRHRVQGLLAAGWKTIRVVTDHGWLLVPGGLPKLDLPKHLTESRWGRCATPETGAQHGFPETGWFWNPALPMVLAPGISSFVKGLEYTHGGLTLQEAMLPVLLIKADATGPTRKPELVSTKWKGLRLLVVLKGAAGLKVDLRTKAADPKSSVLPEDQRGKVVAETGEVSVIVANDDLQGTAVLLVVSTPDGTVIFKQPVNIGDS
jgi:hypothetical protein